MKKSRRQITNRIFEFAALLFVAADLGLFFGVYKPLSAKISAAQRERDSLRLTVRNQQIRVETMQKYVEAVPTAGAGLKAFAENRTPDRREAYSTAAHLIHKLADASGVKYSSVGYRLDSVQHNDPLQRLELNINLQGTYPGLMKFSHALETANDFILVREFSFTPGEDNQPLGLRLAADLYLTP